MHGGRQPLRLDLLRSGILLLIALVRRLCWPGPAGPRPRLFVAILWLFGVPALSRETIRLDWLPAQRSSDRVVIRLKDVGGLLLTERIVATDADRGSVSVA